MDHPQKGRDTYSIHYKCFRCGRVIITGDRAALVLQRLGARLQTLTNLDLLQICSFCDEPSMFSLQHRAIEENINRSTHHLCHPWIHQRNGMSPMSLIANFLLESYSVKAVLSPLGLNFQTNPFPRASVHPIPMSHFSSVMVEFTR